MRSHDSADPPNAAAGEIADAKLGENRIAQDFAGVRGIVHPAHRAAFQ